MEYLTVKYRIQNGNVEKYEPAYDMWFLIGPVESEMVYSDRKVYRKWNEETNQYDETVTPIEPTVKEEDITEVTNEEILEALCDISMQIEEISEQIGGEVNG